MCIPEVVVGELQVDYWEAELVETSRVQVVQFRVLDVEHVIEHRVELVLQRADHALERHHFLADHHDLWPDHAGEIIARARRNAAPYRTVERRVVQYERAAHAARDERERSQEVQAEQVHGFYFPFVLYLFAALLGIKVLSRPERRRLLLLLLLLLLYFVRPPWSCAR